MSTLHQTAARVGAHQWLEQAAWRLLGEWAATGITDHPRAAVLLDTHAQHAAWRAQQWGERLPVLAGIDRPGLLRPSSPGVAAAVEQMGGRGGPATTVARLAAAYRFLLPRLLGGYQREKGLLSTVSDAPVARTLAQAASDAAADWSEGEPFLQTLLIDEAAVQEAAATVAGLELAVALGDPAGEAVQ